MGGDPTAAARLCAACGLCCNGAMFHKVILQPGDSAHELRALGLKIKRKKGQFTMSQPCSAYCEGQCSIYAQRPQRCRLFECRQLLRLAQGEITESAAMEKIQDALRKLALVSELLAQAGETNVERPLSKRCDAITADAENHTPEFRAALAQAMTDFDALLDQDFRISKAAPRIE